MTNTVARFKIGKKVYTTAGLDELSLKDVLLFDSQAADLKLNLDGRPVTWSEIESIAREFGSLDEKQAADHPRALLMTAVTIWASRRVAGDDVTLEKAIDIPIGKLEFLPPTEDHRPRPTKPRSGGKAKKKAAPRRASVPLDPPEAAEPASGETKTSALPSDDA